MARERTRTSYNTHGTYEYVDHIFGGHESGSSNVQSRYWYSLDSPGFPDDHSMHISKLDVTGAELSGDYVSPAMELHYDSFPLVSSGNVALTHLPYDLPVANQATALSALARTSPSRASINPVSLAQDLIDLPKMVGHVMGRIKDKKILPTTARDAASDHLLAIFGIAPIIDDARKLLNLHASISNRVKEIDNLYSRKSITKTVQLGESHNSDDGVFLGAITHNGYVWVRYRRETTAKSWASIKWSVEGPPPWGTDSAKKMRRISQIVEGLTPHELIAGAWDLVPWSFVEDWFTGCGDFIKSHNNSIPATHGLVNIMTNVETRTEFFSLPEDLPSDGWARVSSGVGTHSTKDRDLFDGSLVISLPFLGAGKLSILGSLTVQRLKSFGW